ncbi:MAG: hypothetical protein ACE5LB_15535, partial [Acidiferrobacterales bacterium]
MNFPKRISTLKAALAVASIALGSWAHAQSIGVGGGVSASGLSGTPGSLGNPSARTGSLGSQATVIGDGMGGFTMYNRDGSTSRYLGKSQGNRVYHRDGSSSLAIDDGMGGFTVYGPQGTHRVFPDHAP